MLADVIITMLVLGGFGAIILSTVYMIVLTSPNYKSRKLRQAEDDQQIMQMQNQLRKEELILRGVEQRWLELESKRQAEEFRREIEG